MTSNLTDHLLALALYGSEARGERSEDSDTDLLGISTQYTSLVVARRLRLNIYTQEHFRELINDGSLFVWHLQHEAKIVFDSNHLLRDLLETFKLKSCYEKERREAAQMGWLLFCPDVEQADQPLVIRTLLYCVRTIAYSHLAERATPLFSIRSVSDALQDADLEYLWSLKYNDRLPTQAKRRLRDFLLRQSGEKPDWVGKTFKDVLRAPAVSSFAALRCRQFLNEIRATNDEFSYTPRGVLGGRRAPRMHATF